MCDCLRKRERVETCEVDLRVLIEMSSKKRGCHEISAGTLLVASILRPAHGPLAWYEVSKANNIE